MIDRYSFKDTEKKTLKIGDFVVLTVKEDPKFPARGLGYITALDEKNGQADIWIEEDYRCAIDDPEEQEAGIITRPLKSLKNRLKFSTNKLQNEMQLDLLLLKKQKKNVKNGLKNSINNFRH